MTVCPHIHGACVLAGNVEQVEGGGRSGWAGTRTVVERFLMVAHTSRTSKATCKFRTSGEQMVGSGFLQPTACLVHTADRHRRKTSATRVALSRATQLFEKIHDLNLFFLSNSLCWRMVGIAF